MNDKQNNNLGAFWNREWRAHKREFIENHRVPHKNKLDFHYRRLMKII